MFLVTKSYAQEQPVSQPPAQPAAISGNWPYAPELRDKWANVLKALENKDLEDARKNLKVLELSCTGHGITSYEELSASMIKKGQLLLDSKDYSGATELFESARRISTNYPPAYYASGWGYLNESKLKVLKSVDTFMDGFSSSLDDFWWSFYYAGNKFTSVLFTLAALFSLFGILMAFRYSPLFAHDLSEIFNKPELENKIKFAVLPGFFVLVLLLLGYWWAATLVFLSLWVYFNKKEKALAIIFFLLLVFMPEIMAKFATFAGAGGNRLLWIMDDVNKGHIQKDTNGYLLKLSEKEPDNQFILMSLAQIAKKEKRYPDALGYYDRLIAMNPGSAIYRNNRANILFLSDDLDGAIKEYNAAIQSDPKDALAYFNLAQTYGESLMFTEREAADSKARGIAPSLIAELREKTGEERVSMVFDALMPVGWFWNVSFADTPNNSALADSLWSTMVKLLPLSGARVAGIGFIVLTLGINALRRRGTFAHFCQKCGKVTCKKCQRPHYSKELCPQCHLVFVKLEGVEAKDRVRKMLEVREKDRKEGVIFRVASLVLPGTGHFLMGHPLRGFVFMGMFVFFIKDIFFGSFFKVPYDFDLPFIRPDAIALTSLMLLFYLIAQMDTHRIIK